MAQDVLDILPEAVVYDSTIDTYLLEYNAFIPVIIEGMKEQQCQIEMLETIIKNNKVKNASIQSAPTTYNTNEEQITDNAATLNQNIPNPFDKNTKIAMYIPSNANKAILYIYNMPGNQIASYPITECQNTSITIEGNELEAGMHLLPMAGQKINLLGMDACLMAMLEVYYQFGNYVEIGVASQETEPGYGWDYTFLTELTSNPNMAAKTLASKIVDYYGDSYSDGEDLPEDSYDYTLSAFYIDSLSNHTDETSIIHLTNNLGHLLSSYMLDNFIAINSAQNNCGRFNNRCAWCPGVDQNDDIIDIYEFATNLIAQNINSEINSCCQKLINKLDNSIINNAIGSHESFAHGLSIYFEKFESEYDSNYNTSANYLEFTKFSSWDEMLKTYYNNSTIEWENEINHTGGFYVSPNANLTIKDNTNINLWLFNNSTFSIDRNCDIEANVSITHDN